MVIQSVRSHCNSSTLPYVSTLMEKMDAPLKLGSKAGQVKLSSNKISRTSTGMGKNRTSLILRAESMSSYFNFPVLLLVLVGSLFCGSIIANQSLKLKIAEMEKMREHLKETQVSINAQIKRIQRQLNQEMFQKFDSHEREFLEEKVVKLTSNLGRLEEILLEEREMANQARYDRELLSEKVRTLEQVKESKEKELISAMRTMARLQAIDE
jgi:hypothetical protein